MDVLGSRKLCAHILGLTGVFLELALIAASMIVLKNTGWQTWADIPPAAIALYLLWLSVGCIFMFSSRMWLEAERELEAALASQPAEAA